MKRCFIIVLTTLFASASLWAQNNVIHYTATEKLTENSPIAPDRTKTDHTYDAETHEGVITFDGDVTEIGWMAFTNCTSLTSITLPGTVRTISNNAFYGCTGLTSIALNEGLETICQMAFYNCTALTHVTFPSTLRTFGQSVFAYCTGLTSVTLNEGLEVLSNSMFTHCTALASISLPASIRVLDQACFYNCHALTDVHVHWTEKAQIPVSVTRTPDEDIPYVNTTAFMQIAKRAEMDAGKKYATLHTPVGLVSLYNDAALWKDFGTVTDEASRAAYMAEVQAAAGEDDHALVKDMAADAISRIETATNYAQCEGITQQALADMAKAKAFLPTEGTAGPAVKVTKGEKSATFVNPDKVEFINVTDGE